MYHYRKRIQKSSIFRETNVMERNRSWIYSWIHAQSL
jgi:hypothetical protein